MKKPKIRKCVDEWLEIGTHNRVTMFILWNQRKQMVKLCIDYPVTKLTVAG